MPKTPLTHHDIIRHAAPLSRCGYQVNMARCDRTDRCIEFKPTCGDDNSLEITMAMEIAMDGGRSNSSLTRVVTHVSGLVSTLTASFTDIGDALTAIEKIPTSRQLDAAGVSVMARSYVLKSEHGSHTGSEQLILRYMCADILGLELRVDASTGGSYPAEVRVLRKGLPVSYASNALADGDDAPSQHRAAKVIVQRANNIVPSVAIKNIPEDLLAVLGPQWRPLVDQGDHWKGIMRLLGKGEKRTHRCERYFSEAIEHLHTTLSAEPSTYHPRHQKSRWRVYFRRLRPVLMFTGIVVFMLVGWFLLKDTGIRIHPLTQGLTPLLMVGVVALTARAIPVMEIPATPKPLNNDDWTAADTENTPVPISTSEQESRESLRT